MSASLGFPNPEQLIPHRGAMLLVRQILDRRSDGVSCEGQIPPGNPFAFAGRVPALVAIELAAQAAAVFESLHRAEEGSSAGPRVGYLVSVKAALFFVHDLAVGEPLVAHVRRAGGASPLALFDVRVEREGHDVMTATLGVYAATSGGVI